MNIQRHLHLPSRSSVGRGATVLRIVLSAALGLVALVATAPVARAAVAAPTPTAAYSLNTPVGVAYGPDGRLWATDFYAKRVVRFDQDGHVDRTIDLPSAFQVARGLELDSRGDLWVVDSHNAIAKLAPDGTVLELMDLDRIFYPTRMTIDADDHLVVPTRDGLGVEIRSRDGREVLRTIQTGDFAAVKSTSDGGLLVATATGEVRRYSRDGTLEQSMAFAGTEVVSLEVDRSGSLWLGDGRQLVNLSPDGEVLQTVRHGAQDALDLAVGPQGTLAASNWSGHAITIFALGPAFTGYAPTISGTSRVGDVLSVSEPTGATPQPASVSYAWTVEGSDAVRRTTRTFIPGPGDLGRRVTVAVTLRSDGSESSPPDLVRKASTTVLPQRFEDFAPTIGGSGVVGDELTVKAGTILPNPASTTYAWTVAGSDEVRSTTASFTPAASDKGKKVTATVTATGENGTPESMSRSASVVVRGKGFGLLVATYTGSPVVGGKVVAGEPAGVPVGTTVTSQWQLRDDAGSSWSDVGADGAFSPRVEDLDHELRLVQKLTADGHEDTTIGTAVVTIGKGVLDRVKPRITGTAKVGEALQASVGELPEGVSVTAWQWGAVVGDACVPVVAGEDSAPTDNESLYLEGDWLGRTVCVSATIGADGYLDSTSASSPVGPVVKGAITIPSPPTISDTTPRVGQRLTAFAPLARAGRTASRNGFEWGTRTKAGTCATTVIGDSYVPTVRDLGKDLCVVFAARGFEGFEDGVSPPAFTTRVREARAVRVSDRTVRKGQRIRITATDLVPGRRYVIRVYGKELTGTAPANGRVSRTWTYPRTARSMTRTIAVIQRDKPRAVYYATTTLRYRAR